MTWCCLGSPGNDHPGDMSYSNVFSFSEKCEKLYAASGKFESPSYPGSYSRVDYACVGHIRAPEGSVITISIPIFDVQASENCTKDYLVVSIAWDRHDTGLIMVGVGVPGFAGWNRCCLVAYSKLKRFELLCWSAAFFCSSFPSRTVLETVLLFPTENDDHFLTNNVARRITYFHFGDSLFSLW